MKTRYFSRGTASLINVLEQSRWTFVRAKLSCGIFSVIRAVNSKFKTLYSLIESTFSRNVFSFEILVARTLRNRHVITHGTKNKEIWNQLFNVIFVPKMPKSEKVKQDF